MSFLNSSRIISSCVNQLAFKKSLLRKGTLLYLHWTPVWSKYRRSSTNAFFLQPYISLTVLQSVAFTRLLYFLLHLFSSTVSHATCTRFTRQNLSRYSTNRSSADWSQMLLAPPGEWLRRSDIDSRWRRWHQCWKYSRWESDRCDSVLGTRLDMAWSVRGRHPSTLQ